MDLSNIRDKPSFNHWLYTEIQHWKEDIHMYNGGTFLYRIWNITIHHFIWSLGFLFNFNRWYCKRMQACADCYVDITIEEYIKSKHPNIDWTKYDYEYKSEYYDATTDPNDKRWKPSDRSYSYWKITSITIRRKKK